MGEQITPDAIGKEVGVMADLRRGHPKPRETKTQPVRLAKRIDHDSSRDFESTMSQKGSEAESSTLQ
jgi:hypothetical protein